MSIKRFISSLTILTLFLGAYPAQALDNSGTNSSLPLAFPKIITLKQESGKISKKAAKINKPTPPKGVRKVVKKQVVRYKRVVVKKKLIRKKQPSPAQKKPAKTIINPPHEKVGAKEIVPPSIEAEQPPVEQEVKQEIIVEQPQAQEPLQTKEVKEIVEGELIVKFKEGTAPETIDEVNVRLSTSVKRNLAPLTYLLAINDSSSTEDKIAQYKSEETVEYAEANQIVTTQPVGEPQLLEENQPVSEPAPTSNLNPTGSQKMYFYTGGTNFEVEEANNEVVADPNDPNSFQSITEEFKVALPQELSPTSTEYFTFEYQGKGIRFKPQVENTSVGTIVNESVIYKDVFDGVDLVFQIKDSSLKELLVLNQKPTTNIFSFDFETFGDIYLREEDKKLIFYDSATNSKVFSIPALFMYDSNKIYNYNIESKISSAENRLKLEYILDDTWLSESERLYPVIVDPSVNIATEADPYRAAFMNGMGDTYISSGSAGSNYSYQDELAVGKNPDDNSVNYTLLKFDISPAMNSYIYSANLYLAPLYEQSPMSNASLNQLNLQDVQVGFGPENLTWNNWLTLPQPRSGARFSTYATEVESGGYIRFDVKQIVQNWVNGTWVNDGFLLHTLDDGNSAFFKIFTSAEYPNAAPTLIIEYDRFPTTSAITPSNKYEKTSPDFKFTYSDADGQAPSFAYIEVATDALFTNGTPPGSPNSIVAVYNFDLAPYLGKTADEYKAGIQISYTPGTSEALTTGLYYWRAVVGDGYADPLDNTKPKKVNSNALSFNVLSTPNFTLDISQPGGGVANSASPVFNWTVTDADIQPNETLESWLRWSNNADFIDNGNDMWVRQSWWSNLVNNQSISFSIPQSLTDGQYYFRLEVWDSLPTTVGAWSNGYSTFAFGNGPDMAFSGDFNADGTDELALYRGPNTFFLANLDGNNQPIVYSQFNFGNTGDKVFSGDFNGDGRDEVALQRGTTFFLANVVNNVATVYSQFNLGNTGDIAFSGDFNADGRDEIALQRLNTFFLANTGANNQIPVVYSQFNFGNTGDIAFSGNFDADGADEIALQRGNLFFLANTGANNQIPVVYSQFYFGNVGDKAFSANFIGDAKSDIALKRDNVFFVSKIESNNYPTPLANWSWSASTPLSGDFDGDGLSDLALITGEPNLRVKINVLKSNSSFNAGGNYSYTFSPVGNDAWYDSGDGSLDAAFAKFSVADLNADGKDDIVALVATNSGAGSKLWAYYADPLDTNASSRFNLNAFLSPPGSTGWSWTYSKLTTGDYNGDGYGDILILRDDENNQPNGILLEKFLSYVNAGNHYLGAPQETSLNNYGLFSNTQIVSSDFNGDNKDDIALFYYFAPIAPDTKGRANLNVLTSNATSFNAPALWWESAPNSWDSGTSQYSSGDFNGDNKGDIAILYGYANSRTKAHYFLSDSTKFNYLLWWDSGDNNWQEANTKLYVGDYDGDGRDNLGGFYRYSNSVAAWVFYNKPLNTRSVDGAFVERSPDLVAIAPFDNQTVSTSKPHFELKGLSFDANTTVILQVIRISDNEVVYTKEINMVGGQNVSQYYQYLTDDPLFSLPDDNYTWRITTTDNLNGPVFKDRNFTIKAIPKISNVKVLNLSSTGFIKENQPSFSFAYSSGDNVALLNTVIDVALDAAFIYKVATYNMSNLTNFALPATLVDGRYFYRIRVADERNNSSEYSAVGSFVVDTATNATIDAKVGTILPASSTINIPVVVKNTGTKAIRKSEVILSYRLYSSTDGLTYNVVNGLNPEQTSLPYDLPAGAEASFLATITTPAFAANTSFKLVFDLKRDNEWLSIRGVGTYEAVFSVQNDYNASYITSRAPPAINTNLDTTVSLNLTVKNTGNQTWFSTGTNATKISYKLFNQQGKKVYTGIRTPILNDVAAGGQITQDISIFIPASINSGIYKLSIELLKEDATNGDVYLSTRGVGSLSYPIAIRAYGNESYWPITGNINLLNGNTVLGVSDFSLDGRGPNLDISRSYNSLTNTWRFSFDSQIVETADAAILYESDGGVLYFDRNAADNTFTSPAGLYVRLVENADSSFTISGKDKSKINYRALDGRISSIVDTDNNTLTFSYGANGKVGLITDASGRTVNILYDASDRVSEIQYPASNERERGKTKYVYTGSDLTSILVDFDEANYTGLNIVTTYVYATGKLSNIVSATNSVTTFNYDAAGRLIEVISPVGAKTTYIYDVDNKSAKIISPRGNDLANEAGYSAADFTTTFTYDEAGRIISVRSAEGLETLTYWDKYNNVVAVDDYKATTINQFDDATSTGWANLVKTTTYDKSTSFVYENYISYDEYNNAISGKDSKGNATSLTYDERGNIINTIDSTGITTYSAYDTFGNAIYSTDGIAKSANLVSNSNVEMGAPDGFTFTNFGVSGPTSGKSPTAFSGTYSISQTHNANNQISAWYTNTAKSSVVEYKKYIISAYLRSDNPTLANNSGGVKIWAGFNNEAGTRLLDVTSKYYKTSTDAAGIGAWQRIYLVATAPKDANSLTLYFKQENYLGTAFIDAISIEEADIVSDYNIVDNAGFETSQVSSTSIANWTTTSNPNTTISLIDKGVNEDFDNTTSLPANFAVATGIWSVDSSTLKAIGAGVGTNAFIYTGSNTYADYTFEADATFIFDTVNNKGGEASLVFRSTGNIQNEYRLDVFSSLAPTVANGGFGAPNSVTLHKYTNGVRSELVANTLISGLAPNLTVGGSANIKVEVIGGAIKVYINGIKVIYVIDGTPLLTGAAGVGTIADYSTRFDNIRLTLLGNAQAVSASSYLSQTHFGPNLVSEASNQTSLGTITADKNYTISAYVKTDGFFENFSDGSFYDFSPISGILKTEDGTLSAQAGYIRLNRVTSDFSLEYKIKAKTSADTQTDLAFRSDLAGQNGYRLSINYRDAGNNNSTVSLLKYINGAPFFLTSSQLVTNLAAEAWYKIKLVANANNFKLYINDALALDYTDTDTSNRLFTKGFMTFGYSSSNFYFDDIRVSPVGGAGGAKVAIEFFDLSGTSLGVTTSQTYQTNGRWQLIAFDASAPTNSSYAKVKLIQENFAGSTSFDSIRVDRRMSTTVIYDAAGNYPTSTTDALGNTTEVTYNVVGNNTAVRIRKADGSYTTYTTYTYDALSRLTSTTVPVSNQINPDDYTTPSSNTTTYEYDKDSRLIKTTSADGVIASKTYLANGAVDSIVVSKNGILNNTVIITANVTDANSVQKVAFYVDNALYTSDFNAPFTFVFDTTKVINGNHTLKVTAFDTLGNFSESSVQIEVSNPSSTTASIDTTAPTAAVITSPATGSWSNSATPTISFNPAVDNVAIYKYQLYVDNKLEVDNIAAGATSVTLINPLTGGVHNIYLLAIDTNSNSAASNVISLGVDTTTPSISINSPANQSVVKGSPIVIEGVASSNYAPINAVYVSFTTDGLNWNTYLATGTLNWSYTFSPPSETAYGIVAQVQNTTSSVSATTLYTFATDNALSGINITSPTTGASVSGIIDVVVNAGDVNNIVANNMLRVELYVDDTPRLTTTTESSPYYYTFSYDTRELTNGAHTLKAVGYDTQGNSSYSSISVTVNNTYAATGVDKPYTAGASFALNSTTKKSDFYFTADTNKAVNKIVIFGTKAGTTSVTYTVGLQADNGSGNPSGTYLSSGTFTVTTTTAGFQRVTLGSSVTLTAGTKYHIVVQYASGTVSTSNYWQTKYPAGGKTRTDWGVKTYTTSWSAAISNADPAYILDYTDSTYTGQSYTTAVVWGLYAYQAGEVFTTSVNQTLISASFKIYKYGAPTSNVVATLYDSSNTALATASVPSTSITTTPTKITFNFSSAPMLISGQTYRLIISASGLTSSNTYRIRDVRTGAVSDTEANNLTFGATNYTFSYRPAAGGTFSNYNDTDAQLFEMQTISSNNYDIAAPGSFSIISPAENSWTANTSPTISWSASSDAVRYRLYIDGVYNTEVSTTSAVPAAALSNGRHNIFVVAFDAVNNTYQSPTITFGVDATEPTSTIVSPANNGLINSAIQTLTGNAYSAYSGISRVEVKVNNGSWQQATGTTSWSINVNLIEGANTIEARAFTNNGLVQATNTSSSITLDTTAPSTTISLPQASSAILSKTTYEYDANGNTTKTHNDPDGLNQTAIATYDKMNRIKTATDPAGNTTTNNYNNLGELISVVDAKGYTTSLAYNGVGQKVSQTDAKGNTTYFNYDAGGNLIGTTYPFSATDNLYGKNVALASNGAQAIGSIGAINQASADKYDFSALNDGVTNNADAFIQTDLNLDPKPSLLVILDKTYALSAIKLHLKDGDTASFKLETSLDNKNFKIAAERINVSGVQEIAFSLPAFLTPYESVRFIKLTGTSVNSGNFFRVKELEAFTSTETTVFDYDGEDRVVSQTDQLGYTSFNYYNQSDELAFGVDVKKNVSSFEYDALGRATRTIDPMGNYTTTTYDSLGNVSQVRDQFNTVVQTNTYDAANSLRGAVNSVNHRIKTDYDLMGRVKQVNSYRKNIDGSETTTTSTSTYDSFGRAIKATDTFGYYASRVYDSLSRVVEVRDKKANPTRMSYYADNKLNTQTDALGIVSKNIYDPNGNLESITADYGALNQKTTFVYDELNRLTKVVDPRDSLGNTNAASATIYTAYTYDERGNKKTMTDSKGTTTYNYDANNRLIEAIDAVGNSTYFTYDAEGLLLSASNAAKSITYEYDANNRLTKETLPNNASTAYEYDAKGRLIKVTYPNASTAAYAYDTDDRLLSKTESGNTMAYEYDSADNVVKVTNLGAINNYIYDELNRLVSINNGSTTIATFEYDPNSNLLRKTLPGGITVGYTYDATNRLTGIRTTNTSSTLNETSQALGSLIYDNLDRITKLASNNYVYDLADELIEDNAYTYTYDGNGNILSRIEKASGLGITYTYNAANQLIQSTDTRLSPLTSINYAYDASGNMVSDGTYTYTYDAKDRLIEIKQGLNIIASYAYNIAGQRISKTVGVNTTNYAYNDANKELSSETTGANTKTFSGVTSAYGQLISINISGATYYYVYDAIGQIIGLTDSSGAWAVKYAYDSWGVPTEYNSSDIQQAVGTFGNPYLYKSYYYDAETGLYYLEQRYYNPKLGRFFTRDPLPGRVTNRLSSNAYIYVENDPLIKDDPSGKSWLNDAWNWGKKQVKKVKKAVKKAVKDVKELYKSTNNPIVKAVSGVALFGIGYTVGFYNGAKSVIKKYTSKKGLKSVADGIINSLPQVMAVKGIIQSVKDLKNPKQFQKRTQAQRKSFVNNVNKAINYAKTFHSRLVSDPYTVGREVGKPVGVVATEIGVGILATKGAGAITNAGRGALAARTATGAVEAEESFLGIRWQNRSSGKGLIGEAGMNPRSPRFDPSLKKGETYVTELGPNPTPETFTRWRGYGDELLLLRGNVSEKFLRLDKNFAPTPMTAMHPDMIMSQKALNNCAAYRIHPPMSSELWQPGDYPNGPYGRIW